MLKRVKAIGRISLVLLAVYFGWVLQACAQAPAQQQNPPAKAPAEANPFPEDTSNVPVMPNANTAATPDTGNTPAPAAAPTNDDDPVRSPDQPIADIDSGSADGFSSSSSGLDRIAPPPDEEAPAKKRRRGQPAPPVEHTESAQEDENVGGYYLGQKNWRGALSRYQSALVLDPENPEVYWGLAEAQRHLGDLANAKANYQKVIEYDPDSKHAKDARKLLKDPDMAKVAPPGK